MKARFLLFGLALIIFLVPTAFIGMYIWQAGLDFGSPTSPKAWINVCARGHEATYCQTAARLVRDVTGPIVFIHPNKGDSEILADVVRWSGGKLDVAKIKQLVRANLFLRASLTSGQVVSLDGKSRIVKCTTPDSCFIGSLSISNHEQWNVGEGAVYLSVNHKAGGFDFLTPP